MMKGIVLTGASPNSKMVESFIYWLLYSDEMAIICCWITILVIIALIVTFKGRKFRKSSYYKITGRSYIKTRSNLGTWGEYLTYKELEYLEKEGCKFLFNLYIPKDDGTTTEIDIVVITPSGILVGESKNYSGWIFGNEFQKYWMQTLPKRGESHKTTFLNPIIQNKGHIKWLKTIIGDEVDIRSMIIFSERCTFKDLNMKSDDVYVIQRFEAKRIVDDFMHRPNARRISLAKVDELYNSLLIYSQTDATIKQKHIENIQRSINNVVRSQAEVSGVPDVDEYEEERAAASLDADIDSAKVTERHISDKTAHETKATDTNICPKCGKKLVIRTAHSGKYAGQAFYGCSGYPKCKYIMNIDSTFRD